MAPKKTVLLITAIILTLGLATAQNSVDVSQQEIWLNDESPNEVYFQVDYDTDCEADTEKATVTRPNSDSVVYENLGDNDDVESGDGSSFDYNFTFSNFQGTGTYTIEASCTDSSDQISTINEDEPEEISADRLEMSGLSLTYEDQQENAYIGEQVQGSVELSSEEDTSVDEFTDEDLDFSVAGVSVDGSSTSNGVKTFDFSFQSSEDMTSLEDMQISVEGFDGVSSSTALDVQPVWQVGSVTISTNERITDNTVKYRRLDDLSLRFGVTKSGETVNSLSAGDFEVDGDGFGDGVGWFSKDDFSNSRYTVSLKQNPDISQGEDSEIDVSISPDNVNSLQNRLNILEDLRIERDIVFSGAVLDISRKSVDTDFVADYEDPGTVDFSTDENGNFRQFIAASKLKNMLINFRDGQARLSLQGMEVDKENPGDISYEYYSDVKEKTEVNFDQEPLDAVRPVNLASFISNYNFDAENRNTWAEMTYDTSDIRPQDIEVYECNEWTFRAENCAGEWNNINSEQVSLTPGATWRADFPINPLESDRFEHNQGVLSNAYIVGVPKGVGEGLTLDSSLDVRSRVKSGEEFSISGRVISDSTGESVSGADVSMTLSSEENEVELKGETDSNGNFELSTVIEEAGSYSVSLDASKNPYDSLSVTSNSTIDIYYETGLSVSAESDPEVTLGEPYDIDYTVENIGQASAEDIELTVSGVDSDQYDLVPQSIGSIEAGESSDVMLTLDLSEDLVRPPTINFEASGTSSGEDVRGSATTSVSFAEDVTTESSGTEESQNDDQEDTQNSQSSSIPSVEDVTKATGQFVQSQSDMNLALGLILVFGVVLAAAVRKRKDGGGSSRDDDRMGRMAGGQGRVQKPDVSPTKVEPDESDEDAESEAEEKEEESDDSEYVCDTCGESFDTESGLKLHQQALH